MVFFFFFFRLCSVDAFRHHRHVSAGGTVCEETENTGMPCESFFRFCFRRKKRTIRCCAAFLGLGKPSMPPTTSPGDNTHTKRKPASVFSSCRSSVQVLRFFFSLFFSLSPLASCSLFLYLFFTFATSLGLLLLLCSSQNILGGFFFRKRVRVTRCISHIATSNPPVLQPLWDELLRVSWAAGHYVFTQLPARVGRVAGCCHGALIGSAHGSARCQTKGACCAWMLRSRTMSMYKFMVAKLGSEGIFETEKQTVCTWSTGNRPRVIFIFSVQKKKKNAVVVGKRF